MEQPSRSKKTHRDALAEIERLWYAPAKSAAAGRLDVLTVPAKVRLKPHRLHRQAGELEAA